MSNTANLALPLIAPAQAQKHVTHNEALARLDALVHLAVADRTRAAPPSSPAEGDRHIIAASPTGAWAGHAGEIALYQDGVWTFLAPRAGWRAHVAAEGLLVAFAGGQWAPAVPLNPTPMLGVAAAADATNRLAVASASSLFTHAGAGHVLKFNKATSADTASLQFQTAYRSTAEIGTAGDDRLAFKVQGADDVWRGALIVDTDSAMVAMPRTPVGENLLINGDMALNQRGFAGGALADGVYGFDRWKAAQAGTAVAVSGETITLTSGVIQQVIEGAMGPFGPLAVSVEDLTGGSLVVTVGTVSKTLAPGAGRIGLAFASPGVAMGSPLTVKLAPASGAVTFKRAKVEHGAHFSAWRPRHPALELRLAERFFQVHRGGLVVMSWAGGTAGGYGHMKTPMRATPTVTMAGNATITMFNVGVTTVTPANSWGVTILDEAVFSIAFNNGSPATGGQQVGFLHEAKFHFSAEL